MAQASHGSVLDDLGGRIAAGEQTPGSVLTLAGLESHYGVSRTVVREAVRVLEAMGMVESRRRVGITVRPIDRWNALDTRLIDWQLRGPSHRHHLAVVTELRAAIEPVAAALSARRASDVERAEIARLAGELQRLGAAGLGDSDEYLAIDIAFHELILDTSGNLMLAATKAAISAVIAGRARLGLTPGDPHDVALENHVATARAIARGDAASAEEHTRTYVEAILSEVRSS